MGWPRKGDYRLYQERKDKSYLLVCIGNGRTGSGNWECIANVYAGASPSLATAGTSDLYLHERCRRVEWSDMPAEWQAAFLRYMNGDPADEPFKPEDEPGLWRTKSAKLA